MMKAIVTGLVLVGLICGSAMAHIHASGLWHFDGTMDEELGTGSTSTHWYGYDWVGQTEAQCGEGALDLTDPAHGMQYINLVGDAQINGASGFGLAMWVKRTGTNDMYNSLLGFGSDSLFQLRISGWYPNNGWYRPLNTGFGSLGDSGTPASGYLKTPLDTWSFIALFAYNEGGQDYLGWYSADLGSGQTGSGLIAAPAGSVVNASNTLWLGGAWADGRNSQILVDELVISNEGQDVTWAQAIFDATKDGDNLSIIRNCGDIHRNGLGIAGDVNEDCRVNAADYSLLSDNWGRNNANAGIDRAAELLRIAMDGGDWSLDVSQLNQRTFTVNETPLLGGLSAQIFMDDALLRARFQDMRDHHCNTVLIRTGGVLNQSKSTMHFIETAHHMGLQVYGIPHAPLSSDLLTEHPEIAMLDQYGQSMEVPCPISTEYRDWVAATWDPNVIGTSGIDGFMLDEPTFPQWRMSYDDGRLGCYCADCQARYQAMYGTAMPVVTLPGDYGTQNFNRIIAFRKVVFTEWMEFLCDHLRGAGEDFNISIVFSPDVVNGQSSAYMTAAEATSVDVDAVMQLDNLDVLSVDPYWNAWGRDPSWYADYIPQFSTAPHQLGKGSIFWVQAYLESAGQIERGLHPGELTTAIDNSLGLGVDGIYFWYYEGFNQAESDYDWPEYFDEFAAAVEPYLDRPAERVTIEPVSPIAPNFSFSQVSPGTYQVQMDPNSVGDFSLKFKNAVGITRTLTFDVE